VWAAATRGDGPGRGARIPRHFIHFPAESRRTSEAALFPVSSKMPESAAGPGVCTGGTPGCACAAGLPASSRFLASLKGVLAESAHPALLAPSRLQVVAVFQVLDHGRAAADSTSFTRSHISPVRFPPAVCAKVREPDSGMIARTVTAALQVAFSSWRQRQRSKPGLDSGSSGTPGLPRPGPWYQGDPNFRNTRQNLRG
jgi:hypothetical protein